MALPQTLRQGVHQEQEVANLRQACSELEMQLASTQQASSQEVQRLKEDMTAALAYR